jgi:hypothetical protein
LIQEILKSKRSRELNNDKPPGTDHAPHLGDTAISVGVRKVLKDAVGVRDIKASIGKG